jgi:hypothetical protein
MNEGYEAFISEDSDVSDHEEEENEETEDEGTVEENNMPSLVNNNDQRSNIRNNLTLSEKSNVSTNITKPKHHISKSISQSFLKKSQLSGTSPLSSFSSFFHLPIETNTINFKYSLVQIDDKKNSKSRERSISFDTALLQ